MNDNNGKINTLEREREREYLEGNEDEEMKRKK